MTFFLTALFDPRNDLEPFVLELLLEFERNAPLKRERLTY